MGDGGAEGPEDEDVIPAEPPYRDPLDCFADYIFKNSNAEQAIIHDQDWLALLERYPQQQQRPPMSRLLEDLAPKVVVDSAGVGKIVVTSWAPHPRTNRPIGFLVLSMLSFIIAVTSILFFHSAKLVSGIIAMSALACVVLAGVGMTSTGGPDDDPKSSRPPSRSAHQPRRKRGQTKPRSRTSIQGKGGSPCGGCGGDTIGRALVAMGEKWHPGCFKCSGCNVLLENLKSYEGDGKVYCHSDYHKRFAAVCCH